MRRTLGIDPGLKDIGVGIIDYKQSKYSLVYYSYLNTKSGQPIQARLGQIAEFIEKVITEYQPDEAAIERIFFNRSRAAIEVAIAIGAIMLVLHRAGVPVTQYTPNDVKMAVTGYGAAEKQQVQRMVKHLLGWHKKTMINPQTGRSIKIPSHVYDALAVSLLHIQNSIVTTKAKLTGGGRV